MTLGNALRRVLLSSLQGAAITAVQIDGVLHEFSSISGVREDVTDIILNIKEIALNMHVEGPKRLVREERRVRVSSLPATSRTTADIEILNPDQVICTLDEGAESPHGVHRSTYRQGLCRLPNATAPEDAPIGLMPVDSLYSARCARCPTRLRTPVKARSLTTTS